jgi:hypothetical protein
MRIGLFRFKMRDIYFFFARCSRAQPSFTI